ncbi:MAG TPA: hypothetical protein VG843_02905 [Rhizomicrobium sp.]|jgi:hypothetical protein|nr:hypothetical protein [Rhizomicrobium sp.]
MHQAIEWLGIFGAQIALLAIAIVPFAAAIAVGVYVFNWTQKQWLAWIIGLLSLAILDLMLAPSYQAVERISCRHSVDYELCMEGGPGD